MAPKIGVLTFHRCINYGSYWQGRHLVNGLREMGLDAVLLDHRSGAIDKAEFRCALQPTLPIRSTRADRLRYRLKTARFLQEVEKLPLSPPFDLDEPSTMGEYDLVVVGSDEVWNLFHPWYGGQRLFYGDGIKADRLVSYAASFGNYPADWGLDTEHSDLLKKFDIITVRDENSRTLVTTATGRENELVLDPCLQFAPERLRPALVHDDTPVAVYGHTFSPSLSQNIRRWADNKGLRLISIGYRNEWAHEQLLDAGPRVFYELFENARAVVTNFFHGCVFAIRNAVPFLCETSPYRSNKVQGLVTALGCPWRLVSDQAPDAPYPEILETPLGSTVLTRLGELRSTSDSVLRQALAS